VIRWSAESVVRPTAIEARVAEDNPYAAERLIARLMERAEGLASHPAVGRRVPEAPSREALLSQHIHLYDFLRQVMTYLRWKHGDIDALAPSLWMGRGGRKARTSGGTDLPVDDTDTDTGLQSLRFAGAD